MILQTLRLQSFRAHEATTIDFASKVNLFHGPNGAGKTNVLEAVHYVCLSKSFLVSKDRYMLRKGCSHVEVEGVFSGQQRSSLRVRMVYARAGGKRMFVNGVSLQRQSEIVGQFPVVVFSQADQALTSGGPEERRRFLNNIMSQARAVYLDDLLKYRRALRQRNELLAKIRRMRHAIPSELQDSWDTQLIMRGSRVIVRRLRFLREFSAFLQEAYAQVGSIAEKSTIEYVGIGRFAPDATEEEVAEVFEKKLGAVAQREREQGRTLVGPHRDELVFRVNNFEVRRYASQGQHRTFGMAIKLAQYFYLDDCLEEAPILLLDDVFDSLDGQRTKAFLSLMQRDVIGQTLITNADSAVFERIIPFDAPEHRIHRVEQGRVVSVIAPS